MMAWSLFAAALAVLGGDYAYSRAVAQHARKWERQQVRGPDGVRTDCAGYVRGEGRVALLLVHGFGSSPAVFTSMADDLAARGYACHALRLPGFGEPLPAARQVTTDDWRRALDAKLAELHATHEQVWLVGHSMGGPLCVEAAVRKPDQVDGLVLLAPLCGVSSRRSLGVSPERLFGLRRVLRCTDTFETCFPVDAHDPAVGRLEARDRFVPLNIYENMFEVLRAGRTLAPRVGVPTLVVAAPRDRVVSFRAARRFAEQLSGPRARFLSVAPAGHVLPLDTGWRELCREVDAFVRGGGSLETLTATSLRD